MDINHEHFEKLDSTQTYLIEKVRAKQADQFHLVSANFQSQGKGRGINSWDSYSNSLAFSFTLTPSLTPTLTPLEIAVQIGQFCKDVNLKLKWPNDILTESGEKCGGILIQMIDDIVVVGVGLNWGESDNSLSNGYQTKKGIIYPKAISLEESKILPLEIYDFILNYRLTNDNIISEWNNMCFHLNKEVSIIDNDESTNGVFKKIGSYGEAYIDQNDEIKKVFTGSLIIK